jgi:UDP-GlcNAc:undecaprenyl-phosphate GlcNAc-1-phosphate transferase
VIAAFLLTLLMTPACRAVCRRFGWVDHPDVRKLHRAPIPRAGGIAIFLGYAAAICANHAWNILPALFAAFAIGLLDDLFNLKPRTKLAGQVLAAVLACAAGIQIGGAGAWWHIPLTIVWLVGCANAVNLIDGLDGLATGIGLTATAAALFSALLSGNAPLALVAAPLLGALLGFLPYNISPASIFMGDCGSNTVGFLLGCIAIMWSQTGAYLPGKVAPVVALSIPILDTALTVFRRFLRGQPIFAADRGHVHHRLLCRGFTPRRVVAILCGGGAFAASLSVLLSIATYSGGPVLAVFGIAIWLAIRYLGYGEFDSVRRLVSSGVLRSLVSTDLCVREVEAAISSAQGVDECWSAIQSNGCSLGLSRATMEAFGRTFSAQFPAASTTCWSLRVPLDGVGAINLEIPIGTASASLAPLANSLQTVLGPKLEALSPKLAFAASATGSRRYQTL